MLHRFHRRHAQRFERLELGFEARIFLNALGMKLLIEPLLEPDLFNVGDVARLRPERQPVERVNDLLVFRKLLLEKLGLPPGLFRFFRWFGGGKSRDSQQKRSQTGGEGSSVIHGIQSPHYISLNVSTARNVYLHF
jgi:hypothetical protein